MTSRKFFEPRNFCSSHRIYSFVKKNKGITARLIFPRDPLKAAAYPDAHLTAPAQPDMIMEFIWLLGVPVLKIIFWVFYGPVA